MVPKMASATRVRHAANGILVGNDRVVFIDGLI